MGNLSSMGDLNKGKLSKAEREKRTKLSTSRSLFENRKVTLDLDQVMHWVLFIAGPR